MKAKGSIIAALCLILNVGYLVAQTTPAFSVKHLGIGMHIEQFRVSEVGNMYTAPVNKILLSWNPDQAFKVEPEFGFISGKNKADDLKNSGMYLGLGLFGMTQRNRLNIYGGARLEAATIKWEDKVYTGSGPYTIQKTKAQRYSLSPVVGGEYFLADNFTFGGEVGLKFMAYKTVVTPSSSYNNEDDQTALTTETGLFVRFYFGK
jgi:hypothetical protein